MATEKILIVDDEKSIVLAVESILSTKGYTVEKAYNGKEGLEIAKTFKPDLILLDVMMPFVDGFEFSKLVRSDEDLQDTKIIFITAKGEINDKKDGYSKGGDDYIVKPFSTEQLLSRIEFLLGK
ncbi:response regulator [Aquimarina algicola]|uniref:Response regulator transcription factor n=1 Tax=Aquimarina algicola TaxID=2589995 RepID=A0A504J8H5_9FLAO|nr:response regulator [Aquimarina algicola]TPN82980.1 response regulator transcription factor [Aquimarina algicola]